MNFEEWCIANKPEILQQYFPESNRCRLLSSFGEASKEIAVWRCEKGHGWYAVVYSRKKNGCPVCANRLIIPGINDLKTVDPLLSQQYSSDNPIPVDRISPFSHKHVIWNYPCGHTYSAEVKSRHMGNGCKYCDGGTVFPGINDLQTKYPKIAEDWDYGKNIIGPNQVRPSSNINRHWKCQYCGQGYVMPPYTRLKSGCPHCGKEFKTSFPEKAIAHYLIKAGYEVNESYKDAARLGKMELDIFVPELNLGIEYDGREYHKSVKRDYDKNRRCAHAGIRLIRFREKGCPQILGIETIDVDPEHQIDSLSAGISQLISVISKDWGLKKLIEINLKDDYQTILEKQYISRKNTSLADVCPGVALLLHPDNKIKPTAIPYQSNRSLKWKCPDCKYEWSATVTSVVNSYVNFNRTGCPKCAGKVLVVGENDAATIDPIAAQCWDSERNPDELSDHRLGDTDYRCWKCPKCNTSFKREIYVMCRKGSSHLCEPCSKKEAIVGRFKKVANSGNNVLEKYPAVAKYWDYMKNEDVPENYAPYSEKEKWWICSQCGNSYRSLICVRTRDGGNTVCSKCGKKRGGNKLRINSLNDGENSFERKYPELAKEWHPTLNKELKPSDITPNYSQNVWWYCDVCKQSWDRSPAVRIRGKGDNGCPFCSGRRYCKGINDVKTKCPQIVCAWHPTLNGDKNPEDFRYRDNQKVWWHCPNCGMDYCASILYKVMSGSPLCKGCKISETKKNC